MSFLRAELWVKVHSGDWVKLAACSGNEKGSIDLMKEHGKKFTEIFKAPHQIHASYELESK